jgi:hypothetical protein
MLQNAKIKCSEYILVNELNIKIAKKAIFPFYDLW